MPVDEGVLARWAHELAAGVAAVHATSVAHRDLKARRSPLLVVVEDDRCLVAHAASLRRAEGGGRRPEGGGETGRRADLAPVVLTSRPSSVAFTVGITVVCML